MKRTNFENYEAVVSKVSEILKSEKNMTAQFIIAAPENIETIAPKRLYDGLSHDSKGNPIIPGDWYIVVTCDNDYKYVINVTYDSTITMCAEVFNFIQYK